MLKPLNIYACPGCRGELQRQQDAFRCSSCDRSYRLTGGIPDFLLVRPEESENPVLRDVDKFGKLAAVYETMLWFPLVLRLLGGWHASTLGELVAFARGMMSTVDGCVLDVATGTATYGRHVAGTERTVYGIDISLDMMRKGQAYAIREGVTGMNFSRASADALPFANDTFDGCLLCGSLHTFPDTRSALLEIGRTLKSGAPVWVTSLTWGDSGILKYDWMRRRMVESGKLKIYDVPTLQGILADAGFERIESEVQGSLVSITARKA
jgi:SAM-dependent methyltransferase